MKVSEIKCCNDQILSRWLPGSEAASAPDPPAPHLDEASGGAPAQEGKNEMGQFISGIDTRIYCRRSWEQFSEAGFCHRQWVWWPHWTHTVGSQPGRGEVHHSVYAYCIWYLDGRRLSNYWTWVIGQWILMIRCLPPLGPAAQEGARAVAAVQTQRAPNQPPLVVSSQGHLPQVVKLPPLLPSSRPAVRLRVRRMRELLPPGQIIQCPVSTRSRIVIFNSL